ncbi:MAG TPA: cell division protein ZapB [Candidatus Dormibacteraeota bacterium]|nr:cell division protein ZapB [Candidatus Dormibacteraeota bacterium]
MSKDVIDLLKEKVTLLTEKITTLEQENANLKKKAAELEQELHGLRATQGRLEEGAENFLKFLFDSRQPVSLHLISSAIRTPVGIVEYYRDKLWDLGMITTGSGAAIEDYELMPKGREYVVKYVLQK